MSPSSDSSELPTLAVFDFDGTLTQQDSLLPFLRMVVGQWQFWWKLLAMSPVLAAYSLKLVPNWWAKEVVLTYFLADLTEETLQRLGQCFAVEQIPQLLSPEAVERPLWHQEQGHQTILVSASLEVYLLPWAKAMGFDQATGTQLEIKNDRVTGCIAGKNCYGKEKVKRLRALLGELSNYCVYAYGDSQGDRELLEVANYPFYRSFWQRSDQV